MNSWSARAGVALAFIAVGAAAVILVGGRSPLRPEREALDWTLLGTKDGGRSLVVGFASYYRPCTWDVRAQATAPPGSQRVEVVVTARVGGCKEQSSIFLRPVLARLDRPLNGRVVSGPGRTIRPLHLPPRLMKEWRLGTPDLTGLTLGEAQASGAAFGLTVRATDPDAHLAWRRPVVSQRRMGDVLTVDQR